MAVDGNPRTVSAVLFDLDGVLVESKEATERVWLDWAGRHGIEPDDLRAAMHGVRSVEVVRALRPDLDAVAESEAIERLQAEDVGGLRAVAGAAEAFRALREDRVAVVTSATPALARARLGAVGLELPAVAVFATDVERGKPDPEGYLAAARRLDVPPGEAVVVEDAPPGVEAGRAAGAAVVALTTTHRAAELAAADVVIADLRELRDTLVRDFRATGVLREAHDGH
jgi:mannitol-1-/sugar-/sorbitol-6-phosphatase